MMRNSLILATLVLAAPLAAQQGSTRTISPGMSRSQVVAALGEPVTLRELNDYTYVFYRNTCARACGMNDIVVLRRDSVVDAIFRAPDRHYTGNSSSPAAISPAAARKLRPTNAAPMNLKSDTVMKVNTRIRPAPATDLKPSIPMNTQPVLPRKP